MLLAVLIAHPAALPASKGSRIVAGNLGSRLDAYLTRLEALGFSGAALVARGDEIVLAKGYGWAEVETHRPVEATTIFTIGSITKQFTAAAILKLESMGKLSVHDSITSYFAEVPEDKRGITLHHLLTHTAGFPGAIGDDFDTQATADRFVALAMQTPLESAPGAVYRYSNVGYSLLGILVERLSGQSYEAFLREHFFLPAGMTRTGYRLPSDAASELAVGYREGKRWGTVLERPMLEDGPGWHLRGNGGIHSTVLDMYRWHRALETGLVLPDSSRQKWVQPYADEGGGASFYGYGWSIVPDFLGTRLIAHNGGNGVFSADLRRFPDVDLFIHAMTNRSEWAPVDFITRDLSRMALGHDVDMPPRVVELDEGILEGWVGEYLLPTGGRLSALRDGACLRIEAHGEDAMRLLAGGSPEVAAGAPRLARRSAEILRRSYAGDYKGLYEAFGGGLALDEIAAAEKGWMAMRKQRYGDYKGLEAVAAVPAGEQLRVYLRIDYARGSGWIRYDWEGEQLVGIELVRELPGKQARFYPVSETRFVTYALRNPVRLSLEFSRNGRRRSMVIGQGAQRTEAVARR